MMATFTGPDDSHFKQVITPTQIALGSISSIRSVYPHLGH